MGYDNAPDDWLQYYYKCHECGERVHESVPHDCPGSIAEDDYDPERESWREYGEYE